MDARVDVYSLGALLRWMAGDAGPRALQGLFARKVQSLGWTLVFGTLVGAFLAFLIALAGGKYYLEIMLPGSLVGLLTGYATVRYGRAPASMAMRYALAPM